LPWIGDFELTGMHTGSTIIKMAVWLLPLAMAVAGCRQKEFTPEGKFVDLYVELKMATVAFANDMDKVNEIRRVILAQHHMTPAEFHDHYVRLMAHPEAWRKFQEQVIGKVEEFQSSHKGDS
jgi:hypothetical protein